MRQASIIEGAASWNRKTGSNLGGYLIQFTPFLREEAIPRVSSLHSISLLSQVQTSHHSALTHMCLLMSLLLVSPVLTSLLIQTLISLAYLPPLPHIELTYHYHLTPNYVFSLSKCSCPSHWLNILDVTLNMWFLSFFFNSIVWEAERQTDTHTHTYTHTSHLLAYLLIDCNGQAGSRDFNPGLPSEWQEANYLSHHCNLPGSALSGS